MAQTYDFADEIMFLELNGFGMAFDSFNKSLIDVASCEEDVATSFVNMKLILFFVGIAVLSLCSLALIPFTIFIQKRINRLWKEIKKTFTESSSGIKKVCIQRLEKVHNYVYIPTDEEENTSFNQKHKNFSYMKRYLWRISLFLIAGACFYLVSNYVFMVKFQELLSLKPQILRLIISLRVSLSEALLWMSQFSVAPLNADFRYLSKGFLPLSTDYEKMMNFYLDELHTSSTLMLNADNIEILGVDNYALMIEHVENQNIILEYGIHSAINLLIADVNFLINGINIDIFLEVFYLSGQLTITLETIYKNTQINSERVIIDRLNLYIMFCSVASFVFFVLYAALYFPFLSKEEKKIWYMKELADLIAAQR
jgi:hypothetical protein